MIIAIDFDSTIVRSAGRPYADVTAPFQFMPGARRGLAALKRAGHILVLWSARSSPALTEDYHLDPLVRAELIGVDINEWPTMRALNCERRDHMLRFVEQQLPGIFDVIDDGRAGKLPGIDLFIDDRALRLGGGLGGVGWEAVARAYGETP